MRTVRPGLVILLLAVIGLGLAAWGIYESRRQREEIEQALVTEARLLARSLGPGLAAASSALRELDELVTWKLLDNARLLAALHAAGGLSGERLSAIAEENGLDSAALFDAAGGLLLYAGEYVPDEIVGEIGEIVRDGAEEIVLGSSTEQGIDHVGVAVSTPDGGVILVRVHASSARTFARRLGVENLVASLVGSGGVLYLAYGEEPAGIDLALAWDGGPLPPADEAAPALKDVRGRSVFEVEVPVEAPAGTRAGLRVGLDGAPLNRAAAAAARRTVLAGIVLAGFGLALAGFAIVSRLRTLERQEASVRLAEAEEARRRSERLAAAGTLAAGLAHEVRSPLNAIGIAAQRIERRHDGNDECSGFAGRIRREVRRLEDILREFLEFARPGSGRREPLELAGLAGEVVGLLGDEAAERGVRLEPVQGDARVRADREAVRRSMINLIRNAMQASSRGDAVRTLVDVDAGMARVRVLDEGGGISDDSTEKVFEAFFTTRAEGSGLGLSLVRRVAEEHGGNCSLRSRNEGGVEATFRLPLGARNGGAG
jgi:signal transduction histidine kinase